MTRANIQNQIRLWLGDNNNAQTKANFTALVSAWLDIQEVDDLTKTQVLNDLESYPEFHNLGG
jgi:hypothetical protein